jgi:5-methylcytosine-specific restriction endonuclease McrA
MTKFCSKCGLSFIDRFCKPCKKIYLQEYRKLNKDKVYTAETAWRKINKEKDLATKLRWKLSNPTADKDYYQKEKETIKQRVRDWHDANINYVSEYKKEYYKKNPEVRANGKAKRRASIGNDRLPYGTVPTLLKSQQGLCACCGQPLVKYHIDHIMPLALGGKNVVENVQLLLPRCNQTKSAKHPDVWKAEKGLI